MNILKVISQVLICMVLVICNNALAEELPPLLDLAPLHLEVVKTEVVDQIGSSEYTILSVKPGSGYRLVIVTLKGNIPSPCKIMLWNTDFAAIVISDEVTTTGDKGENKLSYKVSPSQQRSQAIAIDSKWNIPSGSKQYAIVMRYFDNPEPITIEVAFILPATVDKFIVRYPSIAKGKAIVLTEDTKK